MRTIKLTEICKDTGIDPSLARRRLRARLRRHERLPKLVIKGRWVFRRADAPRVQDLIK